MPRSKVSKVDDDKSKKRKRDTIDRDSKSKRHRADQKQKANGHPKAAEAHEGKQTKAPNGRNGLVNVSKKRLDIWDKSSSNDSGWRLSKPAGGRMLDIDPILTADEAYLILTYNTSIQVYSTADSLLVRRIPVTSPKDPKDPKTTNTRHIAIVSTRLSKVNPAFVWVACSDGHVYRINWNQPSEQHQTFRTTSATAKALAVIPITTDEAAREALLVVESQSPYKLDLVAYLSRKKGSPSSRTIFTLRKNGGGLQLLESSEDGRTIVGAFNDRLFLGTASTTAVQSLDQLSYEFFSFDTPDTITTLDLKVGERRAAKKKQLETTEIVDVLVGGARGGIYVYNDLLARVRAHGDLETGDEPIEAKKYHWHRKAVHSAKWSRDGNYMISGGSENVMVLWQMDTSEKNFLPHLSGTVENIVVSASGSSYALHLDDNSAMIVSTAELKPTTYVSGMQSAVSTRSFPKDMLVNRVWELQGNVDQPIPAAIRPGQHTKLHMCVGNGLQATMSGQLSAPLLQSIDLESFTSTMTQPLARTQPTEVNITNKGAPIDEPLVKHISFSADGRWLASVDEWRPSDQDLENISSDMKEQFVRERHEIYLKFWELEAEGDSAALVTRINTPHATWLPETVLDLASHPLSPAFATIGGDGIVRLWHPKTRQQNGIVSKLPNGQDATSWSCAQVIPISDGYSHEAAVDIVTSTRSITKQGSITFSEDGSTIVAAFGADDTGIVYIIDAASGEVIKTIESVWTGQLHSVRTLSPFIIVLSDELRVYDIVGDELRYGIEISTDPQSLALVQLAVDHTSRHFAISLPAARGSSVGVFDPEEAEPVLVRNLSHRAVSLISSPDASGFIVVDDAAQVWSVTEGSDPLALSAVQPLEDMRLDGVAATDKPIQNGAGRLVDEDENMMSDDEEDKEAGGEVDEDVDMEDDDTHASVVAPQLLAEIFDAAPAFAAPSIEDMFYKVTGLLGGKPLASTRE